MIRATGIRHGILDIPYLELAPGYTVVIGPNGSGKTTLLRVLSGLEDPQQGEVRVGGRAPEEMSIGWINEFPGKNSLFLKVGEELASPLRFLHWPCGEISERVEDIAKKFGITHLMDRDIITLSGGEQVLVALATALIAGPDLLILDEWDSHLDSVTADTLHGLVLGSRVHWIIQCTQDMDRAARADTVIFLSRGRVKEQGSPREVFGMCKTTCWYPPSWRCRGWTSSLRG